MANKLTPESILNQEKYGDLKNLVLICEAMDEYAKVIAIDAFNAGAESVDCYRGIHTETADQYVNRIKQ